MRLISLTLVLAMASLATAQGWEKMIAPGLNYRMEIDNKSTRIYHVLRWTPDAPGLYVRSEIAQTRLFASDRVGPRQETSSMLKSAGAIAGVNGDFFAANGDPVGAQVRNGEMLSRPFPGRGVFAWGPTTTAFGFLSWSGGIQTDTNDYYEFTGLNEQVGPAEGLVLFTDAAKTALSPKLPVPEGSKDPPKTGPNVFLVLKTDRKKFGPTGIWRATVERIVANSENMEIADGFAVLVASGKSISKISNLRTGSMVNINMRTEGFDWSKVDNVIGGGPFLLRRGQVNIDWQSAGFNKAFNDTNHPRTAVGRTAKGDVLFVTLDGRQEGVSSGASLDDLALYMQRLGCVDALNLDGGGSTTLSIFGEVMNRPSDGRERRVANGILFFGKPPEPSNIALAIQGPNKLDPLSVQPYRLIGPDGKAVPDREVLWSAQGAGGWIDQGGTARTLKSGAFDIRAFYRGQSLTLKVNLNVPAPQPTATPPRRTNR